MWVEGSSLELFSFNFVIILEVMLWLCNIGDEHVFFPYCDFVEVYYHVAKYFRIVERLSSWHLKLWRNSLIISLWSLGCCNINIKCFLIKRMFHYLLLTHHPSEQTREWFPYLGYLSTSITLLCLVEWGVDNPWIGPYLWSGPSITYLLFYKREVSSPFRVSICSMVTL